MDLWSLPGSARIGGVDYPIRGDFRVCLRIFRCLNDPDLPLWLRWYVAVSMFYQGEIPKEHMEEAAQWLARFLSGGQEEPRQGTVRLLDWEQDAAMIVADVDKVAGTEVRALPFLHWWTFLAYFHAIEPGQLSTVVTIRDKLARGRKLDKWEQEYYQRNRNRVELKKRCSAEEIAQKERLEALLQGESSAQRRDEGGEKCEVF